MAVALHRALVFSLALATAGACHHSLAAEWLDAPGPGYREQIELVLPAGRLRVEQARAVVFGFIEHLRPLEASSTTEFWSHPSQLFGTPQQSSSGVFFSIDWTQGAAMQLWPDLNRPRDDAGSRRSLLDAPGPGYREQLRRSDGGSAERSPVPRSPKLRR